MRILSYATAGGPRAGVLLEDDVFDVNELLAQPLWPIRDVQDLLERPPEVMDQLRESLISARGVAPRRLADLTLLSPLQQPPSIRDHITFEEHATRNFTRQVADVWYRRPIYYYSNPAGLAGSGAQISMPATERLDYELEIAAVVGRRSSDVSEADGLAQIFGFTVMNDWSARDLQADEMAYGLGPSKGKDFATSLGPWVVTTDELFARLRSGGLKASCQVRVNGEVWSEGNALDQHHSWGMLIEHASQDSLLLPGDVIASGTVGGCSIGEALRKGVAAHYLGPGDRVDCDVDAIGVLSNTIIASSRPARARFWAKELPPLPAAIIPGSAAPPAPVETS